MTITANDPVLGRWKTQAQKRGMYGVLQVQAGTGSMAVHNKNAVLLSYQILHTQVLESRYLFVSSMNSGSQVFFVQRYTLTNNSLKPDDNKTPVYFRE
jgi:hypothetical protein